MSGLKDLEQDWQEMVVDIITKTPVSQIVKLSVCTPSFKEEFLIVFVERSPSSLGVANF